MESKACSFILLQWFILTKETGAGLVCVHEQSKKEPKQLVGIGASWKGRAETISPAVLFLLVLLDSCFL